MVKTLAIDGSRKPPRMTHYTQLVSSIRSRTLDSGIHFKWNLRCGLLLSAFLSALSSFQPTSSKHHDAIPMHSRTLSANKHRSNVLQYEKFRSFVPGMQVPTLSLRGGSNEMGLAVQSQGPIDLLSVVPGLMSADNEIRKQAEVCFTFIV